MKTSILFAAVLALSSSSVARADALDEACAEDRLERNALRENMTAAIEACLPLEMTSAPCAAANAAVSAIRQADSICVDPERRSFSELKEDVDGGNNAAAALIKFRAKIERRIATIRAQRKVLEDAAAAAASGK